MAISQAEQRVIQQKSGNRCAFPGCRRPLTATSTPENREVVLGEMAHIIGESVNGPRGDSPMTLEERNCAENIILLCNTHHQLIDSQPESYSVEKLRGMKTDHERWVESTLGRGIDTVQSLQPKVTETIYSNLLPIERMPRFIYWGSCNLSEQEVKAQLSPTRRGEMLPFIIQANTLFAFQDLREPDNPFHRIISPDNHQRDLLVHWYRDPNQHRWLVQLLNRALNKLTGRRGLRFEKRHNRYYFQADEAGKEIEVEYQPLNQQRTSRKVVWQPINKKTGLGRGFWYHRAVSLRFINAKDNNWCLGIRPELRATLDGIQALPSEDIGRRVTRKKARMFNYDLLAEVQFWRDYLSNSSPRLIFNFGGSQSIVIDNRLMEGNITWPGIPAEHAKPFKNVTYLDDIFSWAELLELGEDDEPDDDDEQEDIGEDHDEVQEEDLFDN